MKKITYLIFTIVFLILVSGCSGYKPIFASKNLQFNISEYSIEGNKILGKKIYSKLNRLSKSNKDDQNIRAINLLINSSKYKNSTAKDSAGNVVAYKITLKTKIEVTDFMTDDKILDQTFTSSVSYNVQSRQSDTLKLENRSIDNLIDKTYADLLIKLSQNIVKK